MGNWIDNRTADKSWDDEPTSTPIQDILKIKKLAEERYGKRIENKTFRLAPCIACMGTGKRAIVFQGAHQTCGVCHGMGFTVTEMEGDKGDAHNTDSSA